MKLHERIFLICFILRRGAKGNHGIQWSAVSNCTSWVISLFFLSVFCIFQPSKPLVVSAIIAKERQVYITSDISENVSYTNLHKIDRVHLYLHFMTLKFKTVVLSFSIIDNFLYFID